MQKEKFLKLKNETIIRLINEQDLKRWWVAEMAGVHKTTLRRWLSGRIVKVKENHVSGLAAVLSISASEISE